MLYINSAQSAATTINIGTLAGEAGTKLGWGRTSDLNRTITWSVGALNENSEFAGTITNTGGYSGSGSSYIGNNTNFAKAGTGVLTFSGTSTSHNGSFTVTGGELRVSGAIGNATTTINVNSGLLSATGTGAITAGTLNVASGASLSISATSTVTLNAVNITTNGSASGQLTLPDATTIPTLTITSTSAPVIGTNIQVVNATDPTTIVYTNTPVVPLGYSYNSSTGILTYNGTTISSSTSLSALAIPTNASITVSSGELTIDQIYAANNIIIAPGAKLTLNDTKTLSAASLTIQSNASGTGTFVDKNPNGGLTVTGTGTTNVEQYLSGDGRQWWYLASPVSAASSSIFGSDKVGKHVEDYLNDGNTATNEPYYTSPFTEAEILTAGRGYVVKRAATTAATYNFTGGSLNTGDITLAPTRTGTTAGARGFNLVGNPYPSYIDWDLVYANAINMRNAIWFRTFSGGNMAFHTYGDGDGVPADLATGKIAPMQAFWVKVDLDNTGATLTFKNTHRKHFETGLSNPLKVKALDTRPHLRLVVSNGTATDETLIVGKSYASNELDSYDIEKMTNNNVAIPEIYSVVSNHDLVINSMNELTEGKSVPLGFRPGQTGNFTITATQLENIDTKVMLLDKQAVKEQELTAESPYSFTVTDAAPTNDRFVISFVSRVPTGVEINGKAGDLMVYSNINNRIQLIYRGELTERTAVSVYNVAGQMLSKQKLVKATNELSGTFNPGVYMIRVNDGNQSITKKLIIR